MSYKLAPEWLVTFTAYFVWLYLWFRVAWFLCDVGMFLWVARRDRKNKRR